MKIILECNNNKKLERFIKEQVLRFERDKIKVLPFVESTEKEEKTKRTTKENKTELKTK